VWDLEQLTVKFERVTDAENVDFVVGIISTFQAETRSYGQSDAIWR
jgi:hypothetical protein